MYVCIVDVVRITGILALKSMPETRLYVFIDREIVDVVNMRERTSMAAASPAGSTRILVDETTNTGREKVIVFFFLHQKSVAKVETINRNKYYVRGCGILYSYIIYTRIPFAYNVRIEDNVKTVKRAVALPHAYPIASGHDTLLR